MSAIGNPICPTFIFRQKLFKDYLRNGLEHCCGCDLSGWITCPVLIRVISLGAAVLPCFPFIQMYWTVVKTGNNSIQSFPSRTAHRLQPLNVSINGPCKHCYREAVHRRTHRGNTVSISDAPSIVRVVLVSATTPQKQPSRILFYWNLGIYRNRSVTDRALSSGNEVVSVQDRSNKIVSIELYAEN